MVQARLEFPELVLAVDRRRAQAFEADIKRLRDGVVAAIEVPSWEGQCAVTLSLSGVCEGDFYSRSSRQLLLRLSSEAVEHLLYKLNEVISVGGPSTPEFGEFQAVDETGSPVLRTAKTLRVFLSTS